MRSEADLLLWRSFKTGDWEAYGRIYDTYFGLLNNYGYRFTRDTALIEDAVHDLFVRLWTSRERLGNPPSVKNYLLKSVRNILLRKMKSEEKYTDIDGQEYPVSFYISYNDTIQKIDDTELRKSVRSFIQALPPRQQEVIYLRFYESLSYDEIADLMSISVNSAYKLLYKALERLQTILGGPQSLIVLLLLKLFSAAKG